MRRRTILLLLGEKAGMRVVVHQTLRSRHQRKVARRQGAKKRICPPCVFAAWRLCVKTPFWNPPHAWPRPLAAPKSDQGGKRRQAEIRCGRKCRAVAKQSDGRRIQGRTGRRGGRMGRGSRRRLPNGKRLLANQEAKICQYQELTRFRFRAGSGGEVERAGDQRAEV